MISGRFDNERLPVADVRVYLPIGRRWAYVPMVLDLAAVVSVITPLDYQTVGIDIANLPPAEELGVAGRPETG